MRPAPGSDAPAGFTVLRALDGKRLAKVIRQEGDGPVEIVDFDKAYEYTATPASVLTLHDLYHQLAELQDDPHACIVRGAIAEGADPARMRRLAHEKTDAAPTLVDVPRSIASFDFEPEMTEEEARRIQVIADPDGAVDFALGLCPEEFRRCDLVWSFGSSAGIKPSKLSLHFTLLTDRPVLGYELKAIVEKWNAGRTLFDPSIYGPQSVVYTARPIFEGDAIDPLEGCRIGYRNGTGRPLSLPGGEEKAPPAKPAVETSAPPEAVAFSLVAELVGKASADMLAGRTRQEAIVDDVLVQLRDNRIRQDLAHGAMVALHKASNTPDVLKAHGGRTKPLGWFLEALASIYGTAPRDPRYDVGAAMAAANGTPHARLRNLIEAIREITPRAPRSLGVAALDELLGGGIGEGEALGLGGGPGAFKTSLACTFVESQVSHDSAVLVVAHDEDDRRVARKIGANFGESWGELTSEYPSVLDRLEVTLQKRGAEVFVTRQASGGTLEELVEEFERSISPGRRKVIVVDHLQSVSSSTWAERDTELVQIEKVVRFLIDDLKAKRQYVVIALSEVTKAALNPDSMKNAPLAAFAGTRKVASRFDVPLVLVPDGELRVLVLAPKNRFGKRGEVLLEVDPERWKFISLDVAVEGRVRDAAAADAERKRQAEDVDAALGLLAQGPIPAKGWESTLLRAGISSRRRAREVKDRLLEEGRMVAVEGKRTAKQGPAPVVYHLVEGGK